MERHFAVTFTAKLFGTDTGTGATRGIQRMNLAIHVHEREEISAESAEVRCNDGHGSTRGDGGIGRIATQRKYVGAGLRCGAVGTGDHAEA